jgi:uncharacterized protein (DUF305 family)
MNYRALAAKAERLNDVIGGKQYVLRIWFICLGLFAVSPALATGPAPDRAQARYEVFFMQDMIDHHAMAVHMAMMCQEKAVHPELQTLCANIRNTQTTEIMQMQSWLLQWYGVSYQPQMSQGHHHQMHRLHSLPAEQFEIEFLKRMIRHHWGAVIKGSQCIDRAHHPELIDLCQNIVTTQTAEITLMRTWLCQWYGLCNYGPKGNAGDA